MKEKTAGQRIQAIRGNQTSQEEFGKLLGASQGAVSAWERDDKDRSPSAAIYFRLAALARDVEDTIFFLEQAGLDQNAVVSVTNALLKKGEVEMDAILATAEKRLNERVEDGKQMEDKGEVVLVKPFIAGRWISQKGLPPEPVKVWRVPNKASTHYIKAIPPTVYSAIGSGVAPGDTIIFDASEKDPERLLGHEVLVESGNTLSIGRLVRTQEHPPCRLALTLASDAPDRWGLVYLESTHYPMDPLTGQILGRLVARFPEGPSDFWKRQAGASTP